MVRLGQGPFLFEFVVKLLTDRTVCSISSYKDVTLIDRAVSSLNLDLIVHLGNSKDTLAKVNLFGWN